MGHRYISFAMVALLSACSSSVHLADPIDGIPQARQETISRARLGFRWPLSPGTGTLACAEDGAILFRTGGVIYAVSGRRPGAADITPIRVQEPSALPTNPVKRLKQNERADAFASLMRCDTTNGTDTPCVRAVMARFALSSQEAKLIEAEGRERQWPPLVRHLMPLDPLVERGRALCNR